MQFPSWLPKEKWLNLFLSKGRIPLIVVVLVLILYFTLYTTFLSPYTSSDFTSSWSPDNVLVVVAVTGNAAEDIRPGDVITAVQGRPARHYLWQTLWPPGQESFTYTLQRDNQTFNVEVPVVEPTPEQLAARSIYGFVALLTWLFSAPIILFARLDNRNAWLTGLVFFCLSLSLASLDGVQQDVPAARLVFIIFAPMGAVGFVKLGSILPFQARPQPIIQRVYSLLIGLMGVLITSALVELLFLFPNGSSIEILTGFSIYNGLIYFLLAGLILNPLILLGRYWVSSLEHERRQILILLLSITLAVTPAIINVLTRSLVFPVLAAVAPLSLIPASYGFVIYRRNNLNLDLYVSQLLVLLVTIILLAAIYLGLDLFVRRAFNLAALSALNSYFLILLAFLLTTWVTRPARQAIQVLLYGPQRPYHLYLNKFTTVLAARPQLETLENVLYELVHYIQVRRAQLMEAKGNQLISAIRIRSQEISPIPLETVQFTNQYLARLNLAAQNPTLHQLLPEWVMFVVPLTSRGKVFGLLLLEKPLPDYDYFNGQQIDFILKTTAIMAFAFESIRLFESSLEMSRELRTIRDRERFTIASRIHDEPLQRTSLILKELNLMIAEWDSAPLQSVVPLQIFKENLQSVSRQLREICAGLYLPVLQQGIEWVIRDVMYNFQQYDDTEILHTIHVPADLILPQSITISIYHILVEALNNIHKHANATRIWITLDHQNESNLCLRVEDNGHGSELEAADLPDLVRNGHFGLVGMHSWARSVNGHLTLGRHISGGTSVQFTVQHDSTTLKSSQ